MIPEGRKASFGLFFSRSDEGPVLMLCGPPLTIMRIGTGLDAVWTLVMIMTTLFQSLDYEETEVLIPVLLGMSMDCTSVSLTATNCPTSEEEHIKLLFRKGWKLLENETDLPLIQEGVKYLVDSATALCEVQADNTAFIKLCVDELVDENYFDVAIVVVKLLQHLKSFRDSSRVVNNVIAALKSKCQSATAAISQVILYIYRSLQFYSWSQSFLVVAAEESDCLAD